LSNRSTAKFFLFITILLFTTTLHAESSKTYNHSDKIITSPRCNQFTFDATGSYDPDSKQISFLWDLGDGTQTRQSILNHTYARPGDYKVSLTIEDDSGLKCSTSVSTQTVRVSIPPYADLKGQNKTCVNKPIIFDASKSYSLIGTKLKYSWDFGDGTKSQGKSIVSKSYSAGGEYKMSLKVDDTSKNRCSTNKKAETIYVNEPPIASAGENLLLQCIANQEDMTVSFDASGSTDANNDPLLYFWDFGDGTKGEGEKISHTYLEVGNYDVQLIVDDDSDMSCNRGVDFITVRLNKAPEADAGEDIVSCTGEEVVFDGMKSFANKKGTLDAKWSFGDGQNATGLKVRHVYDKSGTYEAELSVKNLLNSTCPASTDKRVVTINNSPKVEIKALEAICLGSKIEFDASSASDEDEDPIEFYWSFGDGSILRAGPKVSHEFKQGGVYRVSVIADDGKDTPCSTSTASISVKVNTPPAADAGPNHVCCVNTNSLFDATSSSDPDGDLLTYTWDFGDNSKGEGAVTDHIYKESGSYNVFLTVDDNSNTACSKSTAGFIAEVNTAPVPVIKIR